MCRSVRTPSWRSARPLQKSRCFVSWLLPSISLVDLNVAAQDLLLRRWRCSLTRSDHRHADRVVLAGLTVVSDAHREAGAGGRRTARTRECRLNPAYRELGDRSIHVTSCVVIDPVEVTDRESGPEVAGVESEGAYATAGGDHLPSTRHFASA